MRWEEGWWEVVTVDHDNDDEETFWCRSPNVEAVQAGEHEWLMGNEADYQAFKTHVYWETICFLEVEWFHNQLMISVITIDHRFRLVEQNWLTQLKLMTSAAHIIDHRLRLVEQNWLTQPKLMTSAPHITNALVHERENKSYARVRSTSSHLKVAH